MRAQIISIESSSSYADGDRRLLVKFKDGTGIYDVIRLPEQALRIPNLALDDELDVYFVAREKESVIPIDAPGVAAIRHDQQLAREAGE